MVSKCPGQNTQFWGPDDIFNIKCPRCGNEVEFFKDDIRRRCNNCGHLFLNPRINLGCAAWCQYADQCVGTIGKEEFKDILTSAVREHFEGDEEKMGRTLKVLSFAEKILEKEEGNPKVVIALAILYGTGLYENEKARKKPNKSYKEKEEFSIVRKILERSGAKKEITDEVCETLADYSNLNKAETLNARIVHDAVQLAKLSKSFQNEKKTFLTSAGQNMAQGL